MLYIDSEGHLTCDEVQVISDDHRVNELVREGWRILGVFGATRPGADYSCSLNLPGSDSMGHHNQLSLPGPLMLEPVFIMGRSEERESLHGRLASAEKGLREAKVEAERRVALIKTLENKLADARTVAEARGSAIKDMCKKLDDEQARYAALSREVRLVRRAIGEERWRSLANAYEVEEALSGDAPNSGEPDLEF